MSDKDFPANSPDSSKPILQASTLKGDQGDPALYLAPSKLVVPIPTDSDGNNPNYALALVNMRVLEAGTIIGDEVTANGWSILSFENEVNCTGSGVGNMSLNIGSVTNDMGYLDVNVGKTANPTLKIRIMFYKAIMGAQGIQGLTGDTGLTGDQGIQGIQGSPGTGLVMVKQTIQVKEPVVCQLSVAVELGGAWLQVHWGSAHGLSNGDWVYMSSGAHGHGTYQIYEVTEQTFEIEEPWDRNELADVWDMKHFKKGGTYNIDFGDEPAERQTVIFNEIMPVGAKRDQLAFIRTAGDVSEPDRLTMFAGYAPYPDSGYNSYFNGQILEDNGDILQVDLWDNSRTDYDVKFLLQGDDKRDICINAYTYYNAKSWDNYGDVEFEMHLAYKFFDTSYTP